MIQDFFVWCWNQYLTFMGVQLGIGLVVLRGIIFFFSLLEAGSNSYPYRRY